MTMLYLYDDSVARGFEPFALTRPVSELRAGTEILRKRWERVSGRDAAGFASAAHLTDFDERGAPAAVTPDAVIPAGAILANSRCVVALDAVLADSEMAWRCGGQICAVRLATPLASSSLSDGSFDLASIAGDSAATLNGRWLGAVWDFIAQLSLQLADDIAALAPSITAVADPGAILGGHSVTVETGASIDPYVIFDASAGPILVRAGASVAAFTRLVGPCFIGADAVIVGDRIANCSIGEKSKIRGEISSSIVLGHSNKGHTGFVGHSYLGRWVNLGAGTTTSNLKNTYGSVHLWTRGGLVDTQQQFLGTVFGDHVKTGIGTMLNTGTVIGAAANIFGGALHPKHVPAFAWGDGDPYATYKLDKFLDVARRVMQRRGVTLAETTQRQLASAYARATKA
jgi:UDP-N-acetylglucosamine diphosphorylase/glucosamine-1-phosphate N-acetyltransferase